MKKIILIFLIGISVLSNTYAKIKKTPISSSAVLTIESGLLTDITKIQIHQKVFGCYNSSKYTIHEMQMIAGINDHNNYNSTQYQSTPQKHTCRFYIKNLQSMQVAKLTQPTNILGFYFYLSPGDNIKIIEKSGSYVFTGKGSDRLECQYLLNKINIAWEPNPGDLAHVAAYFHKVDSVGMQRFAVLERYKHLLSPESYNILYFDIIEECQNNKIDAVKFHTDSYSNRKECEKFNAVLQNYQNPIWNEDTFKHLDRNIMQHSSRYLDFIINDQYEFDHCFLESERYDIVNSYRYATSNFRGSVRQWLIYSLIHMKIRQNNSSGGVGDVGYCINNSLKSGLIKNQSISVYLKSLNQSGIAGQLAYNFALPDTNGKIVHLSDFKGKVVLLDFYFKRCGACALIHPYLDTISQKLKGRNFVLIAIFWDTEGIKRSEWLDVIHQNIYANPDNINIIARRQLNGQDPEIIKRLGNVGGSSTVYIDKYGKYMPSPLSPRIDGGKAALKFITENL